MSERVLLVIKQKLATTSPSPARSRALDRCIEYAQGTAPIREACDKQSPGLAHPKLKARLADLSYARKVVTA
jgi:hypothetical protein